MGFFNENTPYASTTGTATVSGTGSRLDIGGGTGSQLFVGQNNGVGILNISNSAVVTANARDGTTGFVDARARVGIGGIGTVDVSLGGSLVVQDVRAVGSFGSDDGIQIGGSTIAGQETASSAPGTGTINVDGTGSVLSVKGNATTFINIGQANNQFYGTAASGSGS